MECPLTRYFFDVRASDRTVRDASGMDLRDEAHAIHEATLIIWHLLEDASAEGRVGNVSVSIRTETGACLFEASTSPVGE